MTHRPDREAESLAAAGRLLLESLERRAAVDEAVGILRGCQGGDAAQALHDLTDRAADVTELGAEAARVAALADARAEGSADPDYRGWT